MLNTPGDGTPRSIMSGLFIVARDSAVESKLGKATPTTITIERKEDEYSQSVENLTVKVDGKTYPMTGKEITIEGLKENTSYDVEISYEIEGETCKSSIKAQTKEYYAGLNFISRSHGFIVEKYKTDEVLRTVSASIKVGEKTYEMADVETYEISGLLKNTSYEISYRYVVENIKTKERYEKESEIKTYKTLTYEIPEIESFEIDRKTMNKISIKYRYNDPDKKVKEAYIKLNEETRTVESISGIETFEGLNTYKEGYILKLVIKYEDDSGRIHEIESEEIEVEKEECPHEYDNECDEECNICGEKRNGRKKELFGDEYLDYNLVFCHSSGRPMEGQVINRALKKLIKDNDLPDIVFHSFRHASITYKLKWNGGDMKSVQGDSGHARMDMVADVYSHIIDEDRRYNAQKFEEQFYNAKGLKNVEEGKTAPMPKFETSVEFLDPMAEVQEPPVEEEENSDDNSVEENASLIAKLLSNPEAAALLKALAKTI